MKTNNRKHYIDNIRWATVLLVILYHAVYIFNSAGVISNIPVKGIRQMDALLYFVYPWFMVLLFVVAGMSARYSLENKSSKAFAKEKVKRLLVPSIAGMFIFGWMNGWVTNQYVDMFAGNGDMIPGIAKYLIYCLAGIGPLWFAHELFLASMMLLLIRAVDKKDRIWKWAGKAKLPILFVLVFAVWGSSMVFNTPLIEVYRNGIYIFMFFLGYYVFSHEEVTDILVKYKIPLITSAVITGIIYTIHYFGENYAAQICLQSFFTNFYAWIMILAVLGCFKAWGEKENKLSNYMTKRNFGFYVLHYPVLVLLAYFVMTYLHLPMILNYGVILAGEAIILPIVYEIISRTPLLCILILGKSRVKVD